MAVNKIYFSYDANDYVKEIAKKHTESDITIYGRIEKNNLKKDDYYWYLDLRKYGSIPVLLKISSCLPHVPHRRAAVFFIVKGPEIFHYISLGIRAPIS